MKIDHIRQNYGKYALHRRDLDSCPFNQFEKWLVEALEQDPLYANAMSIATVDSTGAPNIRTVLLKGADNDGFRFFTNTCSQKGRELSQNPKTSLLFHWLIQERQVRVKGIAQALPKNAVENYFQSRPRGSQITACASRQSQTVDSRLYLEQKIDYYQNLYQGTNIELPEDWGGYLVKPTSFEFWQGQADRLHDRFQYKLDNGQWEIQRLAP